MKNNRDELFDLLLDFACDQLKAPWVARSLLRASRHGDPSRHQSLEDDLRLSGIHAIANRIHREQASLGSEQHPHFDRNTVISTSPETKLSSFG